MGNTYFRKRKNSIGLGKGVVASKTTFTDADIEGCDPEKLKKVLSLGWVVKLSDDEANEIQASNKSVNKDTQRADTAEAKVTELQKQLKGQTERADTAEAKVTELQDALYKGWDEMTVDELSAEFTIPELKDIGVTYLELSFKGNPNEKTIAATIVEAVSKKV